MNNNSQKEKQARYIPVPNWEKYYEWPKIGGLRNLIYHRKTNGFEKFGVVKKIGKRVFINEHNFLEWMKSHPEKF